ncbi:sensor domain-containing diguanylate cyclase [Martelella alba]|uniref:Sensor domain-containing diguanylate cyclase n=1 Tax=Martelella alba TaxID=2590451 RepID=A0A506U9Y2_9HYPH|nr:sensor domain-containing diguanylate cyclase [Martelella alba]TPW30166.1 sensor domain-containing diguanylate cyclase [Martelella alba]
MFELAPIAMWLEDFSGVKALFDGWRREGVSDIRAFLTQNPALVTECARAIKVLRINARTLELFEARDFDHLVTNLETMFAGDMMETHLNELVQLFEGKTSFSSDTVNYTLTGRRLDIRLHGTVLPGSKDNLERILVTTEDVTERENARRAEQNQVFYSKGLFEHSPVSLWVEDFSRIRQMMEDLRRRGISDLRVFTDVHPEFVRQCMSEIRVIDVNQATLELFNAPDRQSLLQNQHIIFRDDMHEPFREQLIDLWEGRLMHVREVMNYALDGTERYVLLQFSVFPGREHDWSLVLVSLTDITARKKAEAYLEYLGKHDVLTKLYNRAFYTDEINRLNRKAFRPVAILIIDLNGLKDTNDTLGHDVGDNLLRRLGEVLNEAVSLPNYAARIGGDEFAVLMPGAQLEEASLMAEDIGRLLHVNNQYYSQHPLSISLGIAVCVEGEPMEVAIRRADREMYREKRAFYAAATNTLSQR